MRSAAIIRATARNNRTAGIRFMVDATGLGLPYL